MSQEDLEKKTIATLESSIEDIKKISFSGLKPKSLLRRLLAD